MPCHAKRPVATGFIFNTFQTTFRFLCRLKIPITHVKVQTIVFNYSVRCSTPNEHTCMFLQLLKFPCSYGTIESCRISVGCLKHIDALPHLEIEMMMNVYQIVMTNTSLDYNVFWVFLTLSKSRITSRKNIMYYSNVTVSGVLRGFTSSNAE